MTNPTGTNTTGGSNGNTWSNATNPTATASTGNLAASTQGNQTQNNTSSGSKSSIFDSIFGN